MKITMLKKKILAGAMVGISTGLLFAMEKISILENCNLLKELAQAAHDAAVRKKMTHVSDDMHRAALVLAQSRNNINAALLRALRDHTDVGVQRHLIVCGADEEYVKTLQRDIDMYGLEYVVRFAIQHQDVPKLRIVCDAGLEQRVRSSFELRASFFWYALRVKAGPGILRTILNDPVIGLRGNHNAPALFLREALDMDDAEALELLLKSPGIGEYLNYDSPLINNTTPLFYAITKIKDGATNVLLQDMQVDVNRKITVSSMKRQYTPLQAIILFFPQDIGKKLVKVLLQRGDVTSNAITNGKTILMYAVDRGDMDLVTLLLQYSRPNEDTLRTALERAEELGDDRISYMIRQHQLTL